MFEPETLNVTVTGFVYQPVLHEPVVPPDAHVQLMLTSALAAAGADSAIAAATAARAPTLIALPRVRPVRGTGR
jgi:hypothetical protein